MQTKLIFTRKVLHSASFWKWKILELGNGQSLPTLSPVLSAPLQFKAMSGYFWIRILFFYTNCPSLHTKPVNPDSALQWHLRPDLHDNHIKNTRFQKITGFVWTWPQGRKRSPWGKIAILCKTTLLLTLCKTDLYVCLILALRITEFKFAYFRPHSEGLGHHIFKVIPPYGRGQSLGWDSPVK